MKGRGSVQPENYDHWEHGCRSLTSLTNLHLLYIDMIVWDQFHYYETDAVDQQSLLFILSALKPIRAQTFQVELNMPLSDQTKTSLGPVPFEILHQKRPYDMETFPL